MLQTRHEGMLLLIGQRFIDPEHWHQALRGFFPEGDSHSSFLPAWSDKPYHAYGVEEFEAFLKGTKVAHDLSRLGSPTLEDYLRLHQVAYGFPGGLHWYYENAVKDLVDNAHTTLAGVLLGDGRYEELVAAGLSPSFHGALREEGRFPHFSQHRFWIRNLTELNRLRRNIYLKVTVVEKRSSRGPFLVEVAYPPGPQVRGLLRVAFDRMRRDTEVLKRSGSSVNYRRRAIQIAARFYLDMIAIHPVWDGNGRTGKLVRDMLLLHLGIVPPLHTPSEDLTLTYTEYCAYLATAIEQTERQLGMLAEGEGCSSALKANG